MTTSNARTLKIDIRSLGYDATSAAKERHADASPVFDGIDYKHMFDSSYDAVIVTDKAGNILAYNSRALYFFGYERIGSFDNLSIHALLAGVTDSLLNNISTVIQERRFMRMQAFAIKLDETFVAVETIVMGARKENSDTICYLIRDIQARRFAEQTLLSAFHAMDNTDSSIGIADLDGKITYANRRMISMFGAGDETKVVGQNLSLWFHETQIVKPMIESIMRSERWTTEQRLADDGNAGYMQISVVPDINEDDQLLGMVISIVDTTDRRRAEIAEYQLERDRVMMESLSEACHAIGQPATVLLTSIEVLKDTPEIDFESRKEVEEMCYTAVLELRQCLKEMNAARMSAKSSIKPSVSAVGIQTDKADPGKTTAIYADMPPAV